MLTISPILDRVGVVPLCREAGVPYTGAFYAYRAENRGTILAYALFEVLDDSVRVVSFQGQEDADLFDGLLRAGFQYAGKEGIETGWIPETFRQTHHTRFAALNYPAAAQFDITNFFAKYKNCGTLQSALGAPEKSNT